MLNFISLQIKNENKKSHDQGQKKFNKVKPTCFPRITFTLLTPGQG